MNVYLPIIRTPDQPEPVYPCGMSSAEYAFYRLMVEHPQQCRTRYTPDHTLHRAARYRAERIWFNKHMGHVFDGVSANQNVRDFDYPLPGYYSKADDGNNVESWVARPTAERAFSAFMNSPRHRTHILGLHDFYCAQRAIGVGFYPNPGDPSRWIAVFVVLTAHRP